MEQLSLNPSTQETTGHKGQTGEMGANLPYAQFKTSNHLTKVCKMHATLYLYKHGVDEMTFRGENGIRADLQFYGIFHVKIKLLIGILSLYMKLMPLSICHHIIMQIWVTWNWWI